MNTENPNRYHGKPCKNCGGTERWRSDRKCRACVAEKQRKKYAEDPEWKAKQRARKAEWARKKRAEDPEWKAKERARTAERDRKRRAKDPEWVARRNGDRAKRHHANNFMRNFKSAVLLKGALGDEKTNNNND